MKIYLVAVVLLAAAMSVTSVPVDSEAGKAGDVVKVNVPGPASKPKEFFGSLGDIFSSFGKSSKKFKLDKALNITTSNSSIIDEAKKVIDDFKPHIDGVKKTINTTLTKGSAIVDDVSSKVNTFLQNGDLQKGLNGIRKANGATNINKTSSPDMAQGIGDMFSGILQGILPAEKSNNKSLSLADLGIE